MSQSTTTYEASGLRSADPSLVTYTHAIYGLHALSVFIGLTSPATVVGSFVFGLPSIAAVIMNYVRQNDVRGTFLESHFRWQIRTFWYALAWVVLVGIVSLPLTVIVVGFATWAVGLFVLGIWAIYRIARGWLALNDHRPMPMPR